MALRPQFPPAIGAFDIAHRVDITREVEKTFGAKIEPRSYPRQPGWPHCVGQPACGFSGSTLSNVILRSSFGWKLAQRGDGFEQSRFAGTVLTDKQSNSLWKFQSEVVCVQEAEAIEGKHIPVYSFWYECNLFQEWSG